MSGTGHTVKSYEEEMQSLNDNLVMMGSLTESQMADAMSAVIKVDKESVDKIVKSDGKINELRSIIDNQITTVLVKRAPMAVDLRITISTMKISHDLERIGDLAKSVAKKVKPFSIFVICFSIPASRDALILSLMLVLDFFLSNPSIAS